MTTDDSDAQDLSTAEPTALTHDPLRGIDDPTARPPLVHSDAPPHADGSSSARPAPHANDPNAALSNSQFPSRRLAPPPKPSRDSRPSDKPFESVAPTSIPAPRTPMIVVGGTPSRPVQRAGAQAWNRPLSEAPRASAVAPIPSPVPPRRDPPQRRSEALRQHGDAPRLTPASWPPGAPSPAGDDVRGLASVPVAPPASASPNELAAAYLAATATQKLPSVSDAPVDTPRVPTDPAQLRALASPASSASSATSVEVLLPPAAEDSAWDHGSSLFQSGWVEPGVSVGDDVLLRDRQGVASPTAQEPISNAPVESSPREPLVSALATPPPGADPSVPRPRSEPARLRAAVPRNRASSPGFDAVVRPVSAPPRPASFDSDRPPKNGAPTAAEEPLAPRLPEFGDPGPSFVATPPGDAADAPSIRKSEPPVPASAIDVMKIVAVGEPAEPVAREADEEADEPDAEDAVAAIEVTVDPELISEPLRAAPRPDDVEELPDEDIAPDSGDRRTPKPRADLGEAPPATPVEAATDAGAAPAARDSEQPKPPPPPKRSLTTRGPSLPKPVPQAKRRQKRPWWEDVFSEDFVRAAARVSDPQIRREVDFIEESLGVASGGVMLDLGCGAGHHAVELASRGYGVVGYDLSLYQLALAAEVAQERGQKLNFLQGDMREMAFDEMFDGIFCWNTSFGYFEEEKNLLVAERVFRALRPGGMFLIDVVNRDFVAAQSPCSVWYEGDSCVCMDDMSLDFITSRMRVKRSVILDDGRTRECLYSVRVYSLHELGKLLHDVGFRVTEASGHPTMPGVFFGEQSPRIIVLAQKP